MIPGHWSPTVIRGRRRTPPAVFDLQDQRFYRLIINKDAQASITLNNDNYALSEGAVVLLQPGQMAAWDGDVKTPSISLIFSVFTCDLEQKPDTQACYPIDVLHRQPAAYEAFGMDFPSVLRTQSWTAITDHAQFIADKWWIDQWQHHRANTRLALLLDHLIESHRSHRSGEFIASEDWPHQLAAYLETNIGQIQSVKDLADMVGLSAGHFTRSFREHFCETPSTYLKRKRLQAAENLLSQTDLSINQVLSAVGYPTVRAFRDAWRQMHNMSPDRWRWLQHHEPMALKVSKETRTVKKSPKHGDARR